MMQKFKKGEYVVLLSYPNSNIFWDSMPLNYCYKISQDSNTFDYHFELDLKQNENNGWTSRVPVDDRKPYSYTTFRKASLLEIQTYEILGGPYRVEKPHPNKENYDYLIPIIDKMNAR